jgi:hypothetical protein
VTDRVRVLSERLEEMSYQAELTALLKDRQKVIFEQLDMLTSRARILQRCMVTFYLSLGAFVATSVAIGIVAALESPRYTLAPIICGLIGALFLFYGSILLIFEARLALRTIHNEMDYVWGLSQKVAPAEIVERHKTHFVHFRRRN